jgi:transcription elongation factor Elf1
MIQEFECPECGEYFDVDTDKRDGTATCLDCQETFMIDVDAEFRDGSWHLLTKLVKMP